MTSGLTRGRAVLVALVLAGAILAIGWAPWARGQVSTVLGEETVTVSGSDAAPGVVAAALVAAAAALAVAAGRRVGAVIGAAALLGVAALLVAVVSGFLADPEAVLRGAAGEVSGVPQLEGAAEVTIWPYAALVIAALVAATGALTLIVGRRWPVNAGRRFERPAASTETRASEATRASDARTRAIDDWDALGRGEDPTAGR